MSMKTSHAALIAAILLGLIVAESVPALFAKTGNQSEMEVTASQTSDDQELQAISVATTDDDKHMEAVWAPVDFGDSDAHRPVKRSDGNVDPFWMTSR